MNSRKTCIVKVIYQFKTSPQVFGAYKSQSKSFKENELREGRRR